MISLPSSFFSLLFPLKATSILSFNLQSADRTSQNQIARTVITLHIKMSVCVCVCYYQCPKFSQLPHWPAIAHCGWEVEFCVWEKYFSPYLWVLQQRCPCNLSNEADEGYGGILTCRSAAQVSLQAQGAKMYKNSHAKFPPTKVGDNM